jgi:dihydrodipicolinate reductase
MLSTTQLKPADKIKIAIIGASGKIGTNVLKTIWSNPQDFPNLDKVVAQTLCLALM